MKLTDFLQGVGRPIAYYPSLRRITGSTTATIMLCQFVYWRGKESNGDGWLYKTAEQIEEETGLTYNEQKTARAALKDAGLIEEHYARLDHQMRFKVNLDAINEKWGIEVSAIPECDDSTFGNDGLLCSLNELTETTTEKEVFLTPSEVQEAGEKVNKILAMQANSKAWQGRELIRPDLLPLADCYNALTNQVMTKRVQKSWWKAFGEWKEDGLEPEHIRAAYENNAKWRTVSDPNMLTKDAVAIKAAGKMHKETTKQINIDEDGIPESY